MASIITPSTPSEVELRDCTDFSYFDVMMIGKTGSGKSTIGNKLLGIDPDSLLGVREDITTVIKQWDIESDQKPYFETGEGRESVTKKCKLLSNEETKDRVLDTRGFADTESTRKYGVIKGNLQGFRWILQAQRAHDLRFSRVIYFFPIRGPPERADGHLQEEIKVMHGFFGQKIFDLMVVVVTNNKREPYQQAGFSEEDIVETRKVFESAFQTVAGTNLPKCPPVIYIPFNEDPKTVSNKIVGADVISDKETFHFSPEYPQVRSHDEGENRPLIMANDDKSSEEKKSIFREHRGKCFRFEDRCTRCAIKIVKDKLPSGEQVPIRVVYENGDEEQYHNSFCHPFFIPKHSQSEKFIGGVVHIITLGTGKVYEMFSKGKAWPGFTNSEEMCVSCRGPPGSNGCKPVHHLCSVEGYTIKIEHSNELEVLQLLAEIEDA